ncbi:hypothetical protein [Eggerthella timonensis]|uniref:hypothetical protein n=1 Tax=Eggerthella timonensis TaxID=1871008 RepID=UPI000C7561F7|nr:hypothetical protein [Eggerthella timonensis]
MRRLRPTTRPPILASALFVASLLLFAAGAESLVRVHEACARTSTFELGGDSVPLDAAEAARSALGSFVVWSQDGGHVAANPDLAATVEVDVVSYEGDLGLLLPDTAFFPAEPGACILSSAASVSLFGQPDARGLDVLIDGVPYRAVGSLSNDAPLAVREGDAERAFTRLTTLAFDADGFPVTDDLAASALGSSVETLDVRGAELLAYACLFAYPLALVIALVSPCRQSGTRPTAHWLPRLACLATAGAGALGATAAFASSLTRFGSFYPTTWSDFSAWQESWRSWTGGLAYLAFARQTVFDEPVLIAATAAVLLGLSALAALVAAMLQLRAHPALTRAKHARKQVG